MNIAAQGAAFLNIFLLLFVTRKKKTPTSYKFFNVLCYGKF